MFEQNIYIDNLYSAWFVRWATLDTLFVDLRDRYTMPDPSTLDVSYFTALNDEIKGAVNTCRVSG